MAGIVLDEDFSATSSDFVTITSAHGSYVIPGGLDVQYAVLQRQQGPTVWERCFLSGGKVALRDVASGRYLSAQGDGRICTVVYLLACEKLELVPVGDSGAKFAFKFEAYLQGKRLLQAPSGEGRLVLEPVHSGCSASDVREGQWTVFHLQPAPIPIADSPGYNTSEFAVERTEACSINTFQGSNVVVTGAGPQHLLKQDNPTVWELCHLRGGRVALREPASGRYLAAWNDGSMRLTFRLLEWETYELVIVGDPSSRRVAFRSVHDGRLLQAAPSERMWLGPACVAAELRPGHREVFHLVPVPPVAAGQAARYNTSEFAVDSYEPYTITTAHGTRVTLTACNVQDGAPQARHNSTVWELCRLHGGKVALREPASGRYLSARNDGNVRPLTHLQAWEAWELVPVGDCGSRFAFRSVHGGRLLQAHPEKAHLVLGPAHRVGELDESNWEVFHLVPGHGPEACAVCATGREEVAHWVGFRGCAHQVCGGCAVAWVRQQLNSAMPEAYPLRCMVQGDCPGRLIGTQQLCNPRVSADVLGGQEPLSATDATRYRAFVQRAEEQRQQQQQQQQAVDDQAAMRAMGARPCPWCGFMTIHHKGHGCHHIAPGRGCPGCRQHWCFNCGQRSQIRDGWAVPCRCPIFCTPECTCPVCTECSPGQPCDQCEPGQNCPVCAHGAVPECRQA